MKKHLLPLILAIAIVSGAMSSTKIYAQKSNFANSEIGQLIEDNTGCLSKSSNGKAGKTGSPGETTCTSCHNQNTGTGTVTISSSNLTGWAYTPGQTYTIDVTVAQSAIPMFAFGFEALLASGANAGTLVITNTTETQIKTAVIAGNSRNNVVQKSGAGVSSGSHSYSFNWAAPASGTGNITFYVAGLACNNDGGTSGDYTYTSSQVVTEAVATPAPVANFNASSTNVCEGTAISFTDQSTNTPTSWSWSFGDGGTSTSQNPTHTYTAAGTYTVALTATNGGGSNISTQSNLITVNPTLVPSVVIAPSASSVCPGTTVIFTATPTNGGNATYVWTVDGNNVGTGATYSAIFTNGQAVVCTMTSDATCANPTTATSATVTTGVYTVAPVTISETTGTLNSDATYGNQWYEQTVGILAGATNTSYTPSASGNYYSVVTDANGCVTSSNIINYTFVSINENNLGNKMNIYPNPVKGLANITFENSVNNAQFSIEDFTGRVVYNEELNQNSGSLKVIDMSNYSNGIYFFKLNDQKYKVIKEK